MKNSNSNQKVILFNTFSFQKQGFLGPSHRLYLLSFLSVFALILLFLATLTTKRITSSSSYSSSIPLPPLPSHVLDALLHYTTISNSSSHMSLADLRTIATVLRHCAVPCNFLVFGLGYETPFWNAINYNGRTVFLDENEYFAAWYEERHPHLEAYDILYTTSVAQMPDLIAAARNQAKTDCRPVQNLLFSDCGLAINDLPNHLYEVDWDVILVDGPRGYSPEAPGRMSAIFTAAVIARSRRKGDAATNVFVHDFEREVERLCSEEFLCGENMVQSSGSLAHFVIERADPNSFEFCRNRTSLPLK